MDYVLTNHKMYILDRGNKAVNIYGAANDSIFPINTIRKVFTLFPIWENLIIEIVSAAKVMIIKKGSTS